MLDNAIAWFSPKQCEIRLTDHCDVREFCDRVKSASDGIRIEVLRFWLMRCHANMETGFG
jgi:hypothetical protein